jgi:hypothetical protein
LGGAAWSHQHPSLSEVRVVGREEAVPEEATRRSVQDVEVAIGPRAPGCLGQYEEATVQQQRVGGVVKFIVVEGGGVPGVSERVRL